MNIYGGRRGSRSRPLPGAPADYSSPTRPSAPLIRPSKAPPISVPFGPRTLFLLQSRQSTRSNYISTFWYLRTLCLKMTSISNYTPEQLNEYFRSNYDALVLDLVTVSAIAIVAWEHLLLMPAEIRTWKLLFAGKVLPARVAVLITRYSVIGAMLATGIFFFGRPENCQGEHGWLGVPVSTSRR